jgi:hypothetical protein
MNIPEEVFTSTNLNIVIFYYMVKKTIAEIE